MSPLPKFSRDSMRRLAVKMNVNLDVLPLDEFIRATKIEYEEHGPKAHVRVIKTVEQAAAIALGHILEYFNYYDELEKMEAKLKKQLKRSPRHCMPKRPTKCRYPAMFD